MPPKIDRTSHLATPQVPSPGSSRAGNANSAAQGSFQATHAAINHAPLGPAISYQNMTPQKQVTVKEEAKSKILQGPQADKFNRLSPEKQDQQLEKLLPQFIDKQNNDALDAHIDRLTPKIAQHLEDPNVSEADKQDLRSKYGSVQRSHDAGKNAGEGTPAKNESYAEARQHLQGLDSKLAQLDREHQRRVEFGERSNAHLPHGGKHVPNTSNISGKYLEQNTATGKPALYNTREPREIHAIEKESYVKSHMTSDDFTAIHKFDHEIGASNGQMTMYHRMDGADHGHPIDKSEFDQKMQKDIDDAKKGGDLVRQDDIRRYLDSIGRKPSEFGL
jgi:hypothetical protein